MKVKFFKVMDGDAQSVVGGYLHANPELDIKQVAMCSVAGSIPPEVLISIWYADRETIAEIPPAKDAGPASERGVPFE